MNKNVRVTCKTQLDRDAAQHAAPLRMALSIFSAVAALTLHGGVVAWYHFDEVSPGTPVTSSVSFLNAVDPGKLPGKPYSMGDPDTSDYTTFGSLADFMPVATNCAPDVLYVIDPVSGTTNRNDRSLFFRYADDPSAGKPARYGGCVKVESDSSLTLTNLTVECIVKPIKMPGGLANNGWTLVSKHYSSSDVLTYSLCINNTTYKPYVNIYDADGNLVTSVNGTIQLTGSRSILDGKWHHIAFTVESRTAKLYVDYHCEKTFTLPGPLVYKDDAPLCIGSARTIYKPGGFIDEVRISDEALTTPSFLRFFNTTPIFHAGFEGSLNAEVLHVASTYGIGTSGRVDEAHAYPAFTNDVANVRIVKEADGAVIRKTNGNALYVDGGQVKYPHNADLEMTEMTVECFMKYKEATNYGGLLRFNQSNSNWGTTPIWSVWFLNGELRMRLDLTDPEYQNQTHSFGTSFCDGKWHHLGITFKQFAEGISVCAYDNYRQIGSSWWIPGQMFQYANGSCLGIGTSGKSSYVFSGFIDELRISQGVLPVEHFMRAVPKPGVTVIFR